MLRSPPRVAVLFGFLTLTVPESDQLIVPVGAIRRITLGPADEQNKPGFALPTKPTEAGR